MPYDVWTTKKPTEPGKFYWAVDDRGAVSLVFLAADAFGNGLVLWLPGISDLGSLDDYSHFMGPLQIPDAPGGDEEWNNSREWWK